MKKLKYLLFIFSFTLLFLVACNGGGTTPTTTTPQTTTTSIPTTTADTHVLTHVEAKAATFLEEGNLEYWTCSHCDKIFKDAEAKEEYANLEATKTPKDTSNEGLLAALDFNDTEVTFDGERHQLTYEGIRPEGVKITCTPTTKYVKPGEYQYTLKVVYNGETLYKYANLVIKKQQPKYLGETAYTVYLNDPATQPSFEFDYDDIEVIDQPFYRETGTFKYTLKTVETATMASVEPVEITYTVLESKLGFTFEDTTLVTDGVTPVTLELVPLVEGTVLDETKYEVKYENNSSNVQGKYQAKAQIIDKASGAVVEEYRAIFTVDYAPNEEFEAYVTQTLNDYLEGEQITINLFFEDYEAAGLEHGDASWYKFEGFDSYTQEAYQSDLQTVADERAKVDSFKTQKLSYNQLISLRRIDEYVKFYENILKEYEYEFISVAYIDEYGGYVADLPTYVESYSLRTREDIEDYILMLESTEEAFASYYDYIVAKRDKGYGFSEYTLTKFNSYLSGVISNYESEEGYYLARVVQEKLTAAKKPLELTDTEYKDYSQRLENAVNVILKEAIIDLSNKVDNFLKTETYFNDSEFKTSYYGSTTSGRKLYYTTLQNRLGTFNLSAKDYLAEIEAYTKYYHDAFFAIYSSLTDYANKIMDKESDVIVYDYGDDILNVFNLLYEFADTIVYKLDSQPTIDITWMDPTTTANTTTVAYYMKSPLDSFDAEYIHLNGRSIKNNNFDTLATIAHEGYPGHLYAYVNTKENSNLSNFVKMATYTGHAEGWTKYVENQFVQFLADKFKDTEHAEDYESLRVYKQMEEAFLFMVYTRMDFGVNYEGWDVTKVGNYMKSQGLNSGGAQEAYNTMNESASQYASYGYGQVVFIELHEKAQALLGAAYDEKEFNQVLLRQGWCSLDSLKEYVDEYLNQQAFLLRIELEA